MAFLDAWIHEFGKINVGNIQKIKKIYQIICFFDFGTEWSMYWSGSIEKIWALLLCEQIQ